MQVLTQDEAVTDEETTPRSEEETIVTDLLEGETTEAPSDKETTVTTNEETMAVSTNANTDAITYEKTEAPTILTTIVSTAATVNATTGETATEKNSTEIFQKCKYLNSVRASYTACCQYPVLVVWTWQHTDCIVKCKGADTDGCCAFSCCLYKLGILYPAIDRQGNVIGVNIEKRNLVYSFMLSIGNDTRWEPYMNTVASKCINENGATDVGYECGGIIPMSFYKVVNCVYKENFLNCPTWNPSGLIDCQYTREYVEKCVNINGTVSTS